MEILQKLLRNEPGGPEPTIIVGLGNPGREYRETRHNIGFMVVDRVSEIFGIRIMKMQSKALIGVGTYRQQRVVLVKPQTYMNLSGQAVASIVRFYKTPLQKVLVVHDDLDLSFGVIRLRPSGGSAGQKGIASIIERMGTQDFPRMRMGIGHPPGYMDAAAYVLQGFSKAETSELPVVIDTAAKAAELFLLEGLEPAMNQFNGSILND